MDRRSFLASVGIGAAALGASALSTSCSGTKPIGSLGTMVNISKERDDSDLYPIYDKGEYQVKDFSRLLKDTNLGLSSANIENHLGLYKNYVNKVNAAEKNLRKGVVDEATLKNLAFSLNGMALHDIYFSNMNTDQGEASSAFKKAVEKTFGNFDAYMKNLLDIAAQVKGWSITGVNLLNGHIMNYGEDSHSSNFPNYVIPILALDVYEHAYVSDFSAEGKAQYLDVFKKIIDWDMVSRRFDRIRVTFS